MDDLISRKAVLDRMEINRPAVNKDSDRQRARFAQWQADREAVMSVATAYPKMGKWTFNVAEYGQPVFVCSECGRIIWPAEWDDEWLITYEYCPGCGALMSEALKMKLAGDAVVRGFKAALEGDTNGSD